MGLINNALFIGRSALTTYQSALQIIGNNITNVANPDYVRQNPVLSRIAGGQLPQGFIPGNGVQLGALQRHVDESLEARLRTGLSDRESVLAERNGLTRIESILNELSDNDLSSRLEDFFGAFSALESEPTSRPKRQNVVQTGIVLAGEVFRQRTETYNLRDEINGRMILLTDRANEILTEVASLNVQVVEAESGGKGQAGGLRDQRDALLRELSGLVNVATREQAGGSINVYIGNDTVVQFGSARSLVAVADASGAAGDVIVRYADNNSVVDLRGGELEGLIKVRDEHVNGHLASLDAISLALIREVNVLHAAGRGLAAMSAATGTYTVTDPALSLADTTNGLPFAAQNGSFQVIVTDAQGIQHTTDVFVKIGIGGGPETTLNDLAASIDAVDGVSATITADNRLSITADNGFSFQLANDSSYALAAAGVNTFFVGSSALDFGVNEAVSGDLNLIAVSLDGTAGDGSNAKRIAQVMDAPAVTLSSVSLRDYYNSRVSSVAVTTSATNSGYEASDAIVGSLVAQREAMSGVSLDEEALALIKFERAFQGAARYITVVDELIEEMLNMVR
jgi:flagellar hook-associated protein 1 FlgK